MFQSTLQSFFTIVFPRPSFRVTPSQPDPIYYTATTFGNYEMGHKASFWNFNVSTTKFGETPCTPNRSRGVTSASSSICSIARSHRNSACCCSCSCPYDLSSSSLNVRDTELRCLTTVASSLHESPSPRSSYSTPKASRRRSIGSWNSFSLSNIYKQAHTLNASQDSQEYSTPDDKRLRRISQRISSYNSTSSSQIASLDSFDSPFKLKHKAQPLEFLNTAIRSSAINDLESSISSCSSFDASDNEGTYPSTPVPFPLSSPVSLPSRPQSRQVNSDNFPPAFELSPIIEDSTTFEDMDDIIAYYSDSPILGRINESCTHSEFAFDEADWEPEPIYDAETEYKTSIPDADSVNNDPKRPRRMSFVLKSTRGEESPLENIETNTENNAYKDLLPPPSLTLTFPTPEMQDVLTFPEPVPLVAGPNQLSAFSSIPQTPPSSTRRFRPDRNLNHLVPPTPMPPLPRCTSCGFGFSFDVTCSTDMLHQPVSSCEKCQAQWNRCRKWYGKRGWDFGKEETTDHVVEAKKEKGLKRASKRLSQVMEGVFTTDRRSRQISLELPSCDTSSNPKPSSKRISFIDWLHYKQEISGNSLEGEVLSSHIQADPPSPSALEELGTRVRDYALHADTIERQANDLQSSSPDAVTSQENGVLGKFQRLRLSIKSKTPKSNEEKGELQHIRRRSFLDFSASVLEYRRAL